MKPVAMPTVLGFGEIRRPAAPPPSDALLEALFGGPATGEDREHWRQRMRVKARRAMRYERMYWRRAA